MTALASRLALVAQATCALWCLSLGAAAAAPVVEIRSYAKLEIESVRRQGDELVVTGRLFDPVTLQGLSDNVVSLSVEERALTALTDEEGRFSAKVRAEGDAAAVRVEAAFPGSDALDAANIAVQLDATLAPVELSLSAQPTPRGVELTVHAHSDGVPFAAPITLFVGRGGAEAPLALGRYEAGVPIEVTRKQAGGAGSRTFRAEYAGDSSHQPASVAGSYDLTSTSETTLEVSSKRVAFEDTLTASGQVVDEDGTALAQVSVTLTSGDRRLAQGVTDLQGRYRFRVEGEILGVGARTLQTLAEPPSLVQTSRSAPVIVEVEQPQPVPITYTVIAFLATGLAAGAFFAGRAKPWQRLAKREAPAQQVAAPAEALHGGLVVARPSLVSTLRRANDVGFAGVVRDTVRGRAVGGALVVVRRSGGAQQTVAERRCETSEDGTFAIEDLSPGEWSAEVSAISHITETFPLSIPHRGELRGVRIDLVPVREKVFVLYQRAAMPALPDPKLWGVWSPRQIVDHVRAGRPSPALAVLTDFVEEVYFSARPTEESVIPTARARVEAAIVERAERAPQPEPPRRARQGP